MDHQAFYDPLVVDETHLNRLQDDVDAADARFVGDHLGAGVAWGLVAGPATPTPNLTLLLAAGAGYTAEGRRVSLAGDTVVDLAFDHAAASTAPSGAGLERVVDLYLVPTRTQEESYSDATADPATGYLRQREATDLWVVAGASASTGTATPPAAPAGPAGCLVARVVRAYGQTAFLAADLRYGVVVRAVRAADVHADSAERRLEVSPTDPPSLRVVVAAGAVQINGARVAVAAGHSPLFVAPTTHPCIALLGVAPSGSLTIRYGAEDASPTYPTTSGVLPVAWVGLDPGQTAILDEHLEDARPWLAVDTAAMRVARIVAAGGETTLALPFFYEPTGVSLLVTLNGALLDATEYSETGASSVGFFTPLTTGDRVVVRALDVAPLADDRAGVLVGGELAVDFGGALHVTDVAVCVLGGRALSVAGLPAAVLNDAPSRWMYLYGTEDSTPGTLAVSPTTVVPDAARLFRSDSVLHRYLGPLRYDAAGHPQPFRRIGREHVWLRTKIAGDTEVLAAGADASDTAVSLAAWVPPHARLVRLSLELDAPDGGGEAFVGVAGDAGYHHLAVGGGTGTQYASREVTLECDATQQIVYRVAADCHLRVCVVSFGD